MNTEQRTTYAAGSPFADEIAVVCAGDRNFIMPMKVMLTSLLVNTGSHVHFFIMNTDWTEDDRWEFENLAARFGGAVSFIKVRPRPCLAEFKVTGNITVESYFRLFIPEELPENVTQVIYLDGDIIVEGDIRELWEIPLKGHALMAVAEMFREARLVSSPLALHTYADLQIPPDRKYFNAGVLKINLEKWRREHIAEKIIDYLIRYREKVLWHDQDGLNAVLWDSWGELPDEWNVMTALFHEEDFSMIGMSQKAAEALMHAPKIIHYTNSREKPWKDTCHHPLKERFFYYEKIMRKEEGQVHG